MKRALTIVITFCYLSGVFAPFYTYAGYFINKDFIAENFCINKAKPEMDCEGKCYLVKQLAEQSGKSAESEAPTQTAQKAYTPHFVTATSNTNYFIVAITLQNNTVHFPTAQNAEAQVYSPPEFIA